MKKITSVAAIALLALSFTSCKKDYTCECSIDGTVIGSTTINATKSDAKTACEQNATAGGTSVSCVIK